jgi:hypothetical protein
MGLTFDGVRKEYIGFAWLQFVDWNFLDGQDNLTGTNILLDKGPGGEILAVGKDPDRRWLNVKGQVILSD